VDHSNARHYALSPWQLGQRHQVHEFPVLPRAILFVAHSNVCHGATAKISGALSRGGVLLAVVQFPGLARAHRSMQLLGQSFDNVARLDTYIGGER
jgi:hypothetical protein